MADKLMKKSRRRHKRIPVNVSAWVTMGNRRYEGIVGNVSEEGIAYTITTFIQTDKDFVPRGEIMIAINIPSGAILYQKCEIRWFLKPSEQGNALIMGMKIIEPSSKYRDWIMDIKSRMRYQSEDGEHLF